MSQTAIAAYGLSKRYNIGASRQRTRTLGEAFAAAFHSPVQRLRSVIRRAKNVADGPNTFWAVEDVSFEIRRGDVVGIIGRNGAGKSTLLKILSRITPPTHGYAEIHGRVGSLLEVGTGFHGELTGAQNIFLNGAILGMQKAEIAGKFEEIVAFAEIGRFLDTPVKHYSTGMYMRLAFAVAAHLDPEILLVDEVLAVGDAAFQKKCLGKMDKVAQQGRTVLFVSHNMAAIQSLCKRCLYLEKGRVKVFGTVEEGIRAYHSNLEGNERTAHGEVTLANLRVNGQQMPRILSGAPLEFEFDLGIHADISGYRLFLVLEHSHGITVLHSVVDERRFKQVRERGWYRVRVSSPALWLNEGMYAAHVKLIANGVGLNGRYLSDRLLVMVESPDYDPESVPGLLAPEVTWRADPVWEASTNTPMTTFS